jgi:hypothetical protein
VLCDNAPLYFITLSRSFFLARLLGKIFYLMLLILLALRCLKVYAWNERGTNRVIDQKRTGYEQGEGDGFMR